MTDFVKYIDLKKPPVFALSGTISDKQIPQGVIKTECDVIPPQLEATLDSLVHANNWKPLVDTPFDLPAEADHGQIRPTKLGQLFIFATDAWVMLGHVSTR